MSSRRHYARLAALYYLLMGIGAALSLLYLPSRFIVHGDAAATARNIQASELLYRFGVLAGFVSQIFFALLALALYHLLADVDRRQATLMVVLVLVSVPLSFVNTVFQAAPLALLSGADFLRVFERSQIDALSMGFLRLHELGINTVVMLWGLWLLPFGILVYRSGFIPRFIGVLLIVGCVGYVIISVTAFVLPAHLALVNRVLTLPNSAGELSMMLWLLIKGVRLPSVSAT